MSMLLEGKSAVIMGSGSGVGRASALRFAEEGAKVVVADVQADLGKSIVGELGDAARFVDKHFSLFFEEWLEDWCTDESLWPRRRSRKMFRDWFEVRVFEIVHDAIALPLEVED